MAKSLNVVIDDGTREVVLTNTFGKEICKVYFRPADFSILDRYRNLMNDFEEIVKPLSELNIQRDGTATVDEEWPVLKSVEEELKKRLNALFDMEEADDIFATRNPFSSVGGQFFAQRVLEALGGVIEQAMAEEMDASRQRTEKYLTDTQDTAKKPAAKKATPKKTATKKTG